MEIIVSIYFFLILYNFAGQTKVCFNQVFLHNAIARWNKLGFAIRCCLTVSSLKVDRRLLNDVVNVLAIMIIKRENKAVIKDI